jgi:hypothetical protein
MSQQFQLLLSLLLIATLAVGCSSEDSANEPLTPNWSATRGIQVPPKWEYVRPERANNGAPSPKQSDYIKN